MTSPAMQKAADALRFYRGAWDVGPSDITSLKYTTPSVDLQLDKGGRAAEALLALVAEGEKMKKRPFSDALAERTIDLQVKEIDRLHAVIAKMKAEAGHETVTEGCGCVFCDLDFAAEDKDVREVLEWAAKQAAPDDNAYAKDTAIKVSVVRAAQRALRRASAPAAAEVEEMAKRLESGLDYDKPIRREAAALLRRLAPSPAVETTGARP